jgi:arylsulfatase A-like enzyme
VPLVFMGSGIEPGRFDEVAATVDMAPTVASFIGVPAPADLDGRALIEP